MENKLISELPNNYTIKKTVYQNVIRNNFYITEYTQPNLYHTIDEALDGMEKAYLGLNEEKAYIISFEVTIHPVKP